MDQCLGRKLQVVSVQETRVSVGAVPGALQALRRRGWGGGFAPSSERVAGQVGLGLIVQEPAQLVDFDWQRAGAGQFCWARVEG
eukprot:7112615-Alexandrium_andersonii.AAC.1